MINRLLAETGKNFASFIVDKEWILAIIFGANAVALALTTVYHELTCITVPVAAISLLGMVVSERAKTILWRK